MSSTPPLRVLPGLGLDERSWAPTLVALTAGVDADVLTVPAFGLPRSGGEDLTPSVLADRLAGRLVEELPPGSPVVLAGHSSSCQVVAHVARKVPDLVCGLVLVGPTTDPRASSWHRLAARWLATARHEQARQVPLLVRQYLRIGIWTMARAMDRARRDRIDRSLAAVRCPVTVIRGCRDRICPQDWAASLPGQLVTLPAGAHMVPWTHGPEVARAIRHSALAPSTPPE